MQETPVIAVLRAEEATAYDRVVDVLVENGVRSIELTLTTPGTSEHLPTLVKRLDDAELGVGTVTTVEQARQAVDAGASYLVAPVVDTDVIEFAVRNGVRVYPGALSPTEVLSAWEAGATAVKIFPAETVGPQYGKHLRGPFPDLQFIPSGGVALDDIASWLRAGAAAVSLGGPLVGDALSGGSLVDLATRARRVVDVATAERAVR
ncbi:2-dehydro-3-deoxyphosphogluconate aldolase [Aeromicrobium chenweiae]|uniref:2-dehydro-3-deoxyphosphogluconate aldolase n=1 Tax=Aeromicrobium chenweiae TaxID=2079793 RepID=A0A2S0WRR9_9ACTN|nr:2-dehydro-3-deoxyphosphogluconate aldolase [Aeromicrobium chenweiae]TGN31144.1 bifunctional 4-hydroxy-2-oxoglutarate aldolase/2-dehydro-3-deoxy-phosphogluconate aldolase [Aeromicrobium chenweiae]